MKPALEKHRGWLAVLVLALALLAGWWANRSTEPEAPPPPSAPASTPLPPPPAAQPPRPAPTTLPPAQHAEGAPPEQQAQAAPPEQQAQAASPAADRRVDIFAVHTWEPPPPPPAAAGAAPPPQAPPLPFRFLGRIAEPGEPAVFLLAQGDRVLPAKLGDRIGGAYRLEKFEGGQLYFRYRPMNVVQTLPAGSAQ